ncbi:DivIVA domain-containing protein [Candidatus Contubernalis alkaliaceticus]|uniref:DivIVA domain-containing protein n=1 Tax=Candidatus Contubernalis alkaliaceticus TaxID=338645 RepID=UPI001F4C268E|nr:DivIVA domain-containing protein [Candidatus Contubernalis alkalaceticus]UNC92845.1 DivIVA domain-containing protein [Candidatus Contubernalis alkalaceticus]
MPLTPLDIQNKEFTVALRGFNRDEVNEFLDRLTKDYETMIKENVLLKEKAEGLDGKLEHYKRIEETLQKAILIAQETAEEVKRNANKEAELIRREAEKDASRIIEEARYRASKVLAEHEDLHKQAQVFKLRLRSLVEAQLSALESETWLDFQSGGNKYEEEDDLEGRLG